MTELLDAKDKASSLLQLQHINPDWRIDQNGLKNAWLFKNFEQAVEFMNRVAAVAQAMDHHPEWSNVYNRVSVKLTTHDAGGITALDFHLAKAMQQCAEDIMGRNDTTASQTLAVDDTSHLLHNWVTAFNNEDLHNISHCYAEDALLWGTHATRLIQGREGVAQYFKTVFDSGRRVRSSILESQRVVGQHWRIDQGSYSFASTPVTGPMVMTARFSFVWQLKASGWQIQSHHSSVMPLPA